MAKYVLGRKDKVTFQQFVSVWDNIEQYVSREEAATLVMGAVASIREVCQGKKVGYAWSGGKDSVALQYIVEQYQKGLPCVFCTSGDEGNDMMRFVEEHKPSNLEIYTVPEMSADMLRKHRDNLWFFNPKANISFWYKFVRWNGQAAFEKKHGIECMLFGRRTQDKNFCGGPNGMYYKNGTLRFNPIKDWKHEDVMAVIHYFMNDNLPPVYRDPKNLHMPETLYWYEYKDAKEAVSLFPEKKGRMLEVFPELSTIINS